MSGLRNALAARFRAVIGKKVQQSRNKGSEGKENRASKRASAIATSHTWGSSRISLRGKPLSDGGVH